MYTITVEKRYDCRGAGLKMVMVCCVMLYTLLNCLAPPVHANSSDMKACRNISWPEIEGLLSERGFVSQEELFQLLHQLYSGHQDMIRLDKPVIQKLSSTIESLFPLDECDSITLEEGVVRMVFSEPQDVYVPNSWRQASLKISERLAMRIEKGLEPQAPSGIIEPVEGDNESQSVRFVIESGYLQLDFSFLLKLFGNNLRDGQGRELLYRINPEKQISSLALIESTVLTKRDLSLVHRDPGADKDDYAWIDIHHSDFPDPRDIGICANKISFFGMDIELLPDEMIRFGDEEPRKDSKAYHYFKTGIENFNELFSSEGAPITLDYTRTFGYQFEERKMFMTVGFRSTEDKKRIM